MDEKDYRIPEYEERLKKAADLKKKIDNPEPERLLKTHREMEKEYRELMDDRTYLYRAAKAIAENARSDTKRGGFILVCRSGKNEIGYVQNYSMAGYPEICYADEGRFTLPIASGGHFDELSPKEFLEKIAKGDFKPIDHLCLNCGKMVPYGKKVCKNCGRKV